MEKLKVDANGFNYTIKTNKHTQNNSNSRVSKFTATKDLVYFLTDNIGYYTKRRLFSKRKI